MITDKDRAGWIGASDTNFVIGNRHTKTFLKWWLAKLGLSEINFSNKYTVAGSIYEHSILDNLNIKNLEKDKQILIPELYLRVNLDGNTLDTIYEVKTYKAENDYKISKNYYQQVQVQMFATGIRQGYIVAYPLEEKYYNNYFLDIDRNKIKLFPIEYNECFIAEYLIKLKELAECLSKGVFPK